MVIWLFSSVKEAIILLKILIGFATAPPYKPECKSRFGPVTSTSIYERPRSPVVIEGVSLAIIPVSEIRITSFASFSLLFSINQPKCSLPTSSSPSIINFTLQGSSSFLVIYSSAFTCINIWPLSSQAPRAKIAPSGWISVSLITGSKGGEFHRSKGSGGCTS